MSIVDIVFMFFGALLIFAGLYLFVSGKKDTSSNHVEGVGIKLNVSNPSIILKRKKPQLVKVAVS